MLQTVASANTISYIAPVDGKSGALRGELPMARLGSLLLPRGVASFVGSNISIRAVPQWLFDRSTVLDGAIIRAELLDADPRVSSNNQSVVAGLVLFFAGPWLNNLAPNKGSDDILTQDGVHHIGRVTQIRADQLVLAQGSGSIMSIPFSSVSNIVSPRAFAFNLPTQAVKPSPATGSLDFDTNQIVWRRTRHAVFSYDRASVPASKLSGTEPGITKRALATFVAVDLIIEAAPAIATPLVINKRNQRAAEKALYNAQVQNGVPKTLIDVPSAYNPLR